MSSTAAAETLQKDPPADSATNGLPPLSPVAIFLLMAMVLCYCGFVADFVRRILKTDHYQFAPVYLVAVAGLFYSRLAIGTPAPKRWFRWQPLTVGLSLATLVAALLFASPLLGTVSLLLLIDGLIPAYRMSRQTVRLLWVLVPLPLGYDRSIILELQRLSSVLADAVLDFGRIPHVMSGNVLELPGQRLLVEEACSGLGSIYLLLAVSLLVAVATHLRFVRTLPLALSSVLWAIVGNVVRIVIIAVAHTEYQLDLSSGWPHEILGITTMLLSVAGIAITAVLLNHVVSPVSNVFDHQSGVSRFLTPEILWNVCTTSESAYTRPMSQPGLHIKSRPKVQNAIAFTLITAAAVYWSDIDLQRRLMHSSSPTAASPSLPAHSLDRFNGYSPSTFLTDADIVDLPATKKDPVREWEIWLGNSAAKLTLAAHITESPSLLRPFSTDGWSVLSTRHFPVVESPLNDAIGVVVLGRDQEYEIFTFCCFRPRGEVASAPDQPRLLGERSTSVGVLLPISESEPRLFSLSRLTSSVTRPTDYDVEQSADDFRSIFSDLLRQWKSDHLKDNFDPAATSLMETP